MIYGQLLPSGPNSVAGHRIQLFTFLVIVEASKRTSPISVKCALQYFDLKHWLACARNKAWFRIVYSPHNSHP